MPQGIQGIPVRTFFISSHIVYFKTVRLRPCVSSIIPKWENDAWSHIVVMFFQKYQCINRGCPRKASIIGDVDCHDKAYFCPLFAFFFCWNSFADMFKMIILTFVQSSYMVFYMNRRLDMVKKAKEFVEPKVHLSKYWNECKTRPSYKKVVGSTLGLKGPATIVSTLFTIASRSLLRSY